MFYPVDSLKRGGRFYLCWVADSWPLRFATITHRQLWSQDIRKICDELIELMTNESGRPTNRYSLRLSSQLMRGLVRLYQRKVTVFLSELCMINANVIKHANKKFNVHEVLDLPHQRPQLQVLELPQAVVQEPENEPRVEEMIQNSGNVVFNIQDITLKEAAIPEFQLPPNDGFGEENPDVALQLAGDRSVETMLMMPADASALQHSALGAAPDASHDRSHDASRDRSRHLQVERLSEHDATLFRRSDGESLLPVGDFVKDIPEIPEVPIPELLVPQEKLLQTRDQQQPSVEVQKEVEQPTVEEPRAARISDEIVLEELEETEPQAKRRRIRRKLIIDKNIKISSNVLRARIANPNVELRCQDSSRDVARAAVPCEQLLRRPGRAGPAPRGRVARALTALFLRNLGAVWRPALQRSELQEGAMHRSLRFYSTPLLERIEEVEEPPAVRESAGLRAERAPEGSSEREKCAPRHAGAADALAQEVEASPQPARKRTSGDGAGSTPKRQRSIGYVSFRESQKKKLEEAAAILEVVDTIAEKHLDIPDLQGELDKENVPENKQTAESGTAVFREAEKSVTALLQEAGLADSPPRRPPPAAGAAPSRAGAAPLAAGAAPRRGGDGSETPLGSLDRTKVSLGESEETTDSRRFIRDQWGTEGTMIKILKLIKEGIHAVTVGNLIAKGPVLAGYKAIIAARCFTSILKLKQNGFIKLKKYPDTLEIEDIVLGPKFY